MPNESCKWFKIVECETCRSSASECAEWDGSFLRPESPPQFLAMRLKWLNRDRIVAVKPVSVPYRSYWFVRQFHLMGNLSHWRSLIFSSFYENGMFDMFWDPPRSSLGTSKHFCLFSFRIETAASWRRPLEHRADGGPRMFVFSQMNNSHLLSISKGTKHLWFRSGVIGRFCRHVSFAMNRSLSEKCSCENYLS
jgi:hypothetical protein